MEIATCHIFQACGDLLSLQVDDRDRVLKVDNDQQSDHGFGYEKRVPSEHLARTDCVGKRVLVLKPSSASPSSLNRAVDGSIGASGTRRRNTWEVKRCCALVTQRTTFLSTPKVQKGTGLIDVKLPTQSTLVGSWRPP